MRQFYTQGHSYASYSYRNLKFHKFFIQCTCGAVKLLPSISFTSHSISNISKTLKIGILNESYIISPEVCPFTGWSILTPVWPDIYLLNYKLTFQHLVSYLTVNLIVHSHTSDFSLDLVLNIEIFIWKVEIYLIGGSLKVTDVYEDINKFLVILDIIKI